jgi:hypothetical protein
VAPVAGSVTFGHSYNKANQRIGQTVSDNAWLNYPAATPGPVSYTADALNRYTAVGAVSPTYDANSNLTSDGTSRLRCRKPPDIHSNDVRPKPTASSAPAASPPSARWHSR